MNTAERMKKLESWTPELVIDDGQRVYATILIEAQRCAECRRVMVADHGCSQRVQPRCFRANLRAQVERAGWCYLSGSSKGEEPICKDCERSGHGRFRCSLCVEERAGKPVESWEGDALCDTCYDTVPAKIWDAKLRELEEEHRYDHC